MNMNINPYLMFDGNCEAALNFYAKVLGAKIQAMMPYEGSPAEGQVPSDQRKRVLHGCVMIGDNMLMASDCPPGQFEPMKGFSVTLGVPSVAEAERVFKALSDKGNVQMPMDKTFFAARFGMVADQFGTPWMVICEKDA